MTLAVAGVRTTMLAGTAVASTALTRCLSVNMSDKKKEGTGEDEVNDDVLQFHDESFKRDDQFERQPQR